MTTTITMFPPALRSSERSIQGIPNAPPIEDVLMQSREFNSSFSSARGSPTTWEEPVIQTGSPSSKENGVVSFANTAGETIPLGPKMSPKSRHEVLESKRLGLAKKRVSLERRLFAARNDETSSVSSAGSSQSGAAAGSTSVPMVDPRLSGRGKFMWPDGKTVTGQWFMGQLNGRCFFQWPSGETYDGDTKDGKKHGRGVHTWADGKVYKGQYEMGFEHGFGTLTQADGTNRYRGQFQYGRRHGWGTQTWGNKTYEGEWKNNAVCGRGKVSWKDGTNYEGEFLQGRYHGKGVFVDGKTGRRYTGSWVHGRKEGFGKEVWPQTSQTYEGQYHQGRRHGFGCLTMSDGSTYVGGWERDERAGCGIHVASNGDVLHCGPLFQSNSFVSMAKQISLSRMSLVPLVDLNTGQLSFCDDTDCVQRRQIVYDAERHRDDSYLVRHQHLFGNLVSSV